ncbi:hypothetical protein [Spirosoma oryzicola]|uniref:hypothetical protein n=1 Tax=Spirosoma oryzicola TaxID=2898794 RepID=UPI001E5AF601|nr:hypothetical protein [Spirosoma oryzicola]UHG92415.1 hypothetical protein LQ777_05800 [Spirosoma oryzicola]
MKKPLLYSLFILSFCGCGKKEQELNPDFTVGLTGDYPVIAYNDAATDTKIPGTKYTASLGVNKVDMTHIHVKMTSNFSGTTRTDDIADFELMRDASNPSLYAIYYRSSDIGTITTSEITIVDNTAPRNVTTIKAKR